MKFSVLGEKEKHLILLELCINIYSKLQKLNVYNHQFKIREPFSLLTNPYLAQSDEAEEIVGYNSPSPVSDLGMTLKHLMDQEGDSWKRLHLVIWLCVMLHMENLVLAIRKFLWPHHHI